MSDWKLTGALILGCTLVLYVGRRVLRSENSYRLPPGPAGLPFIGNVVGINISAPWLTYAEWAKTHGDMIHSRVFGKDIIIINSEKIAKDLMEKRSKNYSDRPHLIVNDLCGVDFASSNLPYGNRWRLHKRFFRETFRLDATPRFFHFLHEKACHLLWQLLDVPGGFNNHLFEYTSSVILKTTYDYDTASRKDDIIDVVAKVLTVTVPAVRPDTAIILSAFPFLHRLPSWLPGMSFKREIEMAREAAEVYLDKPFEYSLHKMETSDDNVLASLVHNGLRIIKEKQSYFRYSESWMLKTLKEAAGTAFLAASETSHSVLLTFFLMMMINPNAQKRAQAQIDSVVGKDRLPGIEDRPLLPFIDATLRETLRYSPVVPLSVPHSSVDDDVYDGFYIPKGAILLANLWSMAHDESRYPKPHEFIPERFLNDDGSLKPNDVEHIAFGFGRRMCSGKDFADVSVWSVIAKVLAVFKILKPLDESGAEIEVEHKFSSGLVIHPLPFRCRIVPRTEGLDAKQLAELIASSAA